MRKPRIEPSGTYRRIPLAPHQMVDEVTPTGSLFVLAHLGVPHVSVEGWTLAVDGLVREPLTLTFKDLEGFPKRTVAACHQCAGNPLTPRVPTRRVASVVWGGLDVRDLLSVAGVLPEATFLWSSGADSGDFAGVHHENYIKDLPLDRVAQGDVLLAYEVNGAPLPPEHGFPVRLVVPGFYGPNSVKWLTRVQLADRRADGPFTTTFYNDPVDDGQHEPAPTVRPVWAIPVESVIVSPAPASVLCPASPLDVWGWAWAAAGVREVEVSLDGGAHWLKAELAGRTDYAWQRFRIQQRLPEDVEQATILARATSNDGHVQPPSGARNAIHAVSVSVGRI